MTELMDKEPLTGQLVGEWAAIAELLSELPAAAWTQATALPGWTVSDVTAHLIGTEATLDGEAVPDVGQEVAARAHVRNQIAAANEAWVESMRGHSPEAMLEQWRQVTRRRAQALAAMTDADFAAPSWTPAGEGTYGRYMQIRLFDCWMHEQDIRDATGRSGHEEGPGAETAVDQMVGALGYLVGKRAGAPQGTALTIELTGPVRRILHVLVDGRARVVESIDREPTVILELTSSLFIRLGGGRVDPSRALGQMDIEGDGDLGERIVSNLAFTF